MMSKKILLLAAMDLHDVILPLVKVVDKVVVDSFHPSLMLFLVPRIVVVTIKKTNQLFIIISLWIHFTSFKGRDDGFCTNNINFLLEKRNYS